MEALKVLIIEDDLVIGQGVEARLLDFGYTITDNVANSKDAILAFRRRLPDLVICDIQLKGSKLDGIQLADAFNNIEKVPIIFLTAFGDNKTIARAKKVNPANYLTKPCNESQLRVAIDFALDNFISGKKPELSNSLKVQTSHSCLLYSSSNYFFVKIRYKYVRIEISDIVWIEALGTNVKIITDDFNATLAANLRSFEKQVPHESLIRIHRSFIINVNKIASFDSGRCFLKYKNELKKISIGKTYKNDFHDILPKLSAD